MKEHADWIIRGAAELVTLDGPSAPRSGEAMRQLGLIQKGAVAIRGERIAAAGPESEILSAFEAAPENTLDAEGGVVLPGFVDPHTHLLFAGSREAEFEMRCLGRSYQEITEAGGGIHSSVRSFRAASDLDILAQSRRRCDRILHYGTTTAEVKTGYGLTVEEELRALRLIDTLDRMQAVDLVPTFLGAHEVPDEFRRDRDGYVRLVIEEMLPRVVKETKARYCDVFCEEGVFSVEQARRILSRARELGLGLKIHAEEFTTLGGAELASELHAVSADHLIEVQERGLLALRGSGVLAVLGPATSFSLGLGRYAPARTMVQMEIPIALATDLNPGSSMTDSMPLVMSLACLQMGLAPAEAVTAATVNAAFAVGLGQDRGRIAPGLRADLQVLEAPSYVSLVYALGASHVRWIVKDGVPRTPPSPVTPVPVPDRLP